jgi:hypothetical protein
MPDVNKQDDVGRLIRDAGARELVSAERFEKARARVGDHWQSVVAVERRPHRRSTLPYVAVAGKTGKAQSAK